jgi:putative endonuclease
VAKHTDTGKKGESLAACWLIVQGYQILFKNWREGRGEIDIIARKKNVLHFIEVKTSSSREYGFPEERMNRRKWKAIRRSSEKFLSGWPDNILVQFDIVSIQINGAGIDYHLMEDVFPESWKRADGYFM